MPVRNPKLVGILAAAIFAAATTLALTKPAVADGVSADAVVDALAREGLPVDLGEDLFGDPEIASGIGDTRFDVLFFDCDGDVCETITFSAAYVSDSVSLEDMNDWNVENLHGQAYLDDEDDPNLDFTVFAEGGLTKANLRRIVKQWVRSVSEFEDYIGWNSSSDGAARSEDGAAASNDATIEVCNESGAGVSIAYATASGGTDSSGETLFRSEGWLNIEDGECIDVWDAPSANRYYYVYAEADEGHYGGDYYFCTLEDAFEIVDTQCTSEYEREGFFQIDVSIGSRMTFGYTENLVP